MQAVVSGRGSPQERGPWTGTAPQLHGIGIGGGVEADLVGALDRSHREAGGLGNVTVRALYAHRVLTTIVVSHDLTGVLPCSIGLGMKGPLLSSRTGGEVYRLRPGTTHRTHGGTELVYPAVHTPALAGTLCLRAQVAFGNLTYLQHAGTTSPGTRLRSMTLGPLSGPHGPVQWGLLTRDPIAQVARGANVSGGSLSATLVHDVGLLWGVLLVRGLDGTTNFPAPPISLLPAPNIMTGPLPTPHVARDRTLRGGLTGHDHHLVGTTQRGDGVGPGQLGELLKRRLVQGMVYLFDHGHGTAVKQGAMVRVTVKVNETVLVDGGGHDATLLDHGGQPRYQRQDHGLVTVGGVLQQRVGIRRTVPFEGSRLHRPYVVAIGKGVDGLVTPHHLHGAQANRDAGLVPRARGEQR